MSELNGIESDCEIIKIFGWNTNNPEIAEQVESVSKACSDSLKITEMKMREDWYELISNHWAYSIIKSNEGKQFLMNEKSICLLENKFEISCQYIEETDKWFEICFLYKDEEKWEYKKILFL